MGFKMCLQDFKTTHANSVVLNLTDPVGAKLASVDLEPTVEFVIKSDHSTNLNQVEVIVWCSYANMLST